MKCPTGLERVCARGLCLAAGSAILLGGQLVACLPVDSRPPPGVALVTVSPSAALLAGISSDATEDGWAVRYDRFLIGLGFASLGGEACTRYSNPSYSRIFDLQRPEPQKVSLHHALGHCEFGFTVANRGASVLGAGVSAEDAAFLRNGGNDDVPEGNGSSLYVRGTATRGGVTKSFDWVFSSQIVYALCASELNGTRVVGVELRSGEEQVVELQIAGEALFRDDPDPALARLRFGPLADADTLTGNADSQVTLAELDQVKLTDLPEGAGYERVVTDESMAFGSMGFPPGSIEQMSLADYLYLSAVPNLARFGESGSCLTFGRSSYPSLPEGCFSAPEAEPPGACSP